MLPFRLPTRRQPVQGPAIDRSSEAPFARSTNRPGGQITRRSMVVSQTSGAPCQTRRTMSMAASFLQDRQRSKHRRHGYRGLLAKLPRPWPWRVPARDGRAGIPRQSLRAIPVGAAQRRRDDLAQYCWQTSPARSRYCSSAGSRSSNLHGGARSSRGRTQPLEGLGRPSLGGQGAPKHEDGIAVPCYAGGAVMSALAWCQSPGFGTFVQTAGWVSTYRSWHVGGGLRRYSIT